MSRANLSCNGWLRTCTLGLGATLSDYVAVLEGVPKLTGDEKVEDILKEATM